MRKEKDSTHSVFIIARTWYTIATGYQLIFVKLYFGLIIIVLMFTSNELLLLTTITTWQITRIFDSDVIVTQNKI